MSGGGPDDRRGERVHDPAADADLGGDERAPRMQAWSRQVHGAALRIAELQQRARTPRAPDELIDEALQELDSAQEELRVAEEHLHTQADQMALLQSALDQERERYRELFDGAPDPYLVTDAHGLILDANRRAAALLNVDPIFLSGKPLALYVHAEHRSQFREVLHALRPNAEVASFVWRVGPRAASQPGWNHVSVSRAHSQRGASHVVRWMFREATEHEARSAVELELREKDALLATIAHELRTPLTSLSGWLDLLGLQNTESALRDRAFASMQRSVGSLTRMVEELVDQARFTRGVLSIDLDAVCLPKLVHQCLDEQRPTAQIKNVQLLSSVYEELPEIQGDGWRLHQVVSNLIGNALKFTPPSGHVIVVLVRRADHAEISVRDSGRGIAAESLAKIFEPFVQLHAHAANGGMGLGLHIAYRLVEQHGGTLTAQSAGEGLGSTFTVRLPLGSHPTP